MRKHLTGHRKEIKKNKKPKHLYLSYFQEVGRSRFTRKENTFKTPHPRFSCH